MKIEITIYIEMKLCIKFNNPKKYQLVENQTRLVFPAPNWSFFLFRSANFEQESLPFSDDGKLFARA